MQKEKATPVTEDEIDDIRVTLNLAEGDVECRILSIFEAAGRDYIALMPMDEKDRENDEGIYYLYRYAEDSEGLPSIDNIGTEEEYEAALDRFDEILDEELYDSMG